MKAIIKLLLTILFISILSTGANAQEKKTKIDTAKFEVKGVCNMCKDRIENAALIKGVKWVEWDKATDTLTVIFKTSKFDIMDVHKSVAKAGHTTDRVECNIDAYNKLPGCCAYMGEVKKH
jgi:copper chaperone CopZ